LLNEVSATQDGQRKYIEMLETHQLMDLNGPKAVKDVIKRIKKDIKRYDSYKQFLESQYDKKCKE